MKRPATGFLKRPAFGGYPAEYLISRLKGRSQNFVSDWGPWLERPAGELVLSQKYASQLEGDALAVRTWQLNEYRWIYRQMSDGLRGVFAPYFFYTELKTLHTCLRFRSREGMEEKIAGLLSKSLLSDSIADILMMPEPLPIVLDALWRVLSAFMELGPLRELFLAGGLKAVEESITDAFLEHAAASNIHSVMKSFFSYTVDAGNILAAGKQARWAGRGLRFIKGGGLKTKLLEDAAASRDIARLIKYARKLSGLKMEADVGGLQVLLLKGMLKLSAAMARLSDIGFMLHYLLRCFAEAMNFEVIIHGETVGPGLLIEQLVL